MRTVIAKLDVDEDMLFDIGYEGIIDGLEKEFGWLSPSGINLEEAFISDEDDEVEFGRYINYVVQWAFKHAMDDPPAAGRISLRCGGPPRRKGCS